MHSAGSVAVLFVVWIGIGVGTALLARSKGRPWWEGALLGFIVGLIGLIIEACLPRRGPTGALR